MKTTIFLSKGHHAYAELQAMLSEELNAVKSEGVSITFVASAPPEDALGFGDVAQILIDHKEEIVKYVPFLTAVIQILNTVLQRKGILPKKSQKKAGGAKSKWPRKQTIKGSAFILQTKNRTLVFPCTEERARSFIKSVVKGATSKSKRRKD